MSVLKRKANSARRSPFAAAIVIALGLLLTGGGYAVASGAVTTANANDPYKNADNIAAGKKLFLANCASCHGQGAGGTSAAPSLIGVGAASVDFQVASGRMPGQGSGPQMPTKTPQFNDQQVLELAAYVASLAPGPAVPSDEAVLANGSAERGGELFRINCAMCHNAVGAGGALTEGKYAPALLQAEPREIYEAMVTGPQNMPVFSDTNLTPTDKKDIITYLTYVQTNKSPGGYELANLGPVAEGLFAWIFLFGLIIGITVWLGAKSN